jgi:hypothetical protein
LAVYVSFLDGYAYTFCKTRVCRNERPSTLLHFISRPRSATLGAFFQTNAVWFFARRGAEINIQSQLSPRGARHMINLTQQLEALFSSRLGVGPRLKL